MTATRQCPKCEKRMILVSTDIQQTIKEPVSYLRRWWCGCGNSEHAKQDETGEAFDHGRRREWHLANARGS